MPIMGQAVRKGHIAGVSLGVSGAILALKDVGDGGQVTLIGDVAFIGAVTVVVASNRKTPKVKGGMPIFVYAFPVSLGAGIWLSATSIIMEGSSVSSIPPEGALLGWIDPHWLIWVAYLSIGPGLFGHTGLIPFYGGFHPSSYLSHLLLEPVIGAVIGWLWTDDVIIGANCHQLE